MADHPPPLPNAEPLWATYLKAFGTLFPACFILNFSNAFMIPKLEQLWRDTNLGGSKVQWLLDAALILTRNLQPVIGVALLVVIILELSFKSWPRYHRAVIAVLTIFFHTTVLFAITAIALSVLIAAPLLTKKL